MIFDLVGTGGMFFSLVGKFSRFSGNWVIFMRTINSFQHYHQSLWKGEINLLFFFFPDVHGKKGGKSVNHRVRSGGFGYKRDTMQNKAKFYKPLKSKGNSKRQFSRWPAEVSDPWTSADCQWSVKDESILGLLVIKMNNIH
jgi:hypothetical protein